MTLPLHLSFFIVAAVGVFCFVNAIVCVCVSGGHFAEEKKDLEQKSVTFRDVNFTLVPYLSF